MSVANDGGPAFPVADDVVGSRSGMSLRAYIAAQTLAGFCTMSDETGMWSWRREDAVKEAVQCADALISELAKDPTP